MPVKVYKPTSAGRRGMTGHSFEEITKSKPERSLTEALRKRGGRNNRGKVTVRHRGGGQAPYERARGARRDERPAHGHHEPTRGVDAQQAQASTEAALTYKGIVQHILAS